MPKIHQLSPQEAQKIAAGEVIERPANVVKELIENALDAGANSITLSLENGGNDGITIIDNGCGMSADDARLCIQQYATSKISRVEELNSITTFGFRGEALASIAAVSTMTLITKEAHEIQGIKLTIQAGIIIDESPVACNPGTTIIIHDLFYNVPARKKFLKKKETEWRQILQLIHAFCLAYSTVHFTVEHEGKQQLNCSPASQLTIRAASLWDAAHAQAMIPIEQGESNEIGITGIISKPSYYRYDRSSLFLFVNKRWVKNNALSKAVMKGYLNILPTDRFPAAALFIEVDPTSVDINIHPRKEEVQFLHPRRVETALQESIQRTLEQHLSSHLPQHTPAKPLAQVPTSYTLPTAPVWSMPQLFDTPVVHPRVNSYALDVSASVPEQTVIKNSVVFEPEDFQHIIGQYQKTYILIEQETGLFLVDQHAAHERILYEKFKYHFAHVPTISLLFPEIMHISAEQRRMVEDNHHFFAAHGIGVEIFGQDQLIVQSTPAHAKQVNMQEFIKEALAWMQEYHHLDKELFSKKIHERMHAQLACKAAIKAGDILSHEQMRQLLSDLNNSDNRFSCPHGRPTGWLLELSAIEKKFKRIM